MPAIISYQAILLSIFCALLSVNLRLIFNMIRVPRAATFSKLHTAILAMLACSGGITWALIIQLYNETFHAIPFIMSPATAARFAWPLLPIYYQASSFLMLNLFSARHRLSWDQKVMGCINSIAAIYYLLRIVTHGSESISLTSPENTVGFYVFCIVIVHTLFTIPKALVLNYYSKMPSIHKLHKPAFMCLGILVYSDLGLLIYKLFLASGKMAYSNELNAASLSFFLFTMTLLYRNIKYDRLLDVYGMRKSPQPSKPIASLISAKKILDNAHSMHQLTHLTQMHFKQAFDIDYHSVRVHIKPVDESEVAKTDKVDYRAQEIIDHVEQYLLKLKAAKDKRKDKNDPELHDRNELEFDLHYEEDPEKNSYVELLHAIGADLFIPITYTDDIIGYLTVESHPNNKVYNDVQHDEMLMYTSHLATTVHRLRTEPASKMILRCKKQEDTFKQSYSLNRLQQRIIRAFDDTDKSTGIIACRPDGFVYANPIAEKLCGVDLNDLRNSLVQCIGDITTRIKKYKRCDPRSIRNDRGELLTLAGGLFDDERVIISVNRSVVSAELAEHKKALTEEDDWYYAMALDSTPEGKEISYLYPPNDERFLPFKVKLLKESLSQYPTLLDVPLDDIKPIASMINAVNHTRLLKIFDGNAHNAYEASCLLFGVHKSMRTHSSPRGILEELHDDGGTLLIKNIDCLDADNQKQILEFLNTGLYTPVHGAIGVPSQGRIICTVQTDLTQEAEQSSLNPKLHALLTEHRVSIPSLMELNTEERTLVIKSVDECKLYGDNEPYTLTNDQRQPLIDAPPVSITMLRARIKKIKRMHPPTIEDFEPQFTGALQAALTDEQLYGMHVEALKDPKLARRIWDELKSATVISKRMNIARSSVNYYLSLHGIIKTKAKKTPKPNDKEDSNEQ